MRDVPSARIFIRVTEVACQIRDSGVPWDLKRKLIFSDDISKKLINTGLMPDYDTGPGMLDRDAVTAFVDAAEAQAVQLRRIWPEQQTCTDDESVEVGPDPTVDDGPWNGSLGRPSEKVRHGGG